MGLINAEKTTRENKDTEFSNGISGLDSRLTTTEGKIESLISADSIISVNIERNAADITNLENDLSSLENRVSTTEGEVDEIQSNLSNEINSRTSGDSTLDGKITTEKYNRESADTELSNRITVLSSQVGDTNPTYFTESRTIVSELSSLRTDLNQEISDRGTAISNEVTSRNNAITAAINTEVTNRNTAIGVESKARQDMDDAISEAMGVMYDSITEDIASLSLDLSGEISNRVSGDNSLTTNLNTEITNRTNADNSIITSLNQEITNRQNADNTKVNNKTVFTITSSILNTGTLPENTDYKCGVLTTLSISTVPTFFYETNIYFTSGTTATTVNLPASLEKVGTVAFKTNTSYVMSICNNILILGKRRI